LVISEAEEEVLRRLIAGGDGGSIGDPLAIILRARGAPSHAIASILDVSRRTAG